MEESRKIIIGTGRGGAAAESQKHQSVPVLSRTCQARCLSVVCATAATFSIFTKIATDFTTAIRSSQVTRT